MYIFFVADYFKCGKVEVGSCAVFCCAQIKCEQGGQSSAESQRYRLDPLSAKIFWESTFLRLRHVKQQESNGTQAYFLIAYCGASLLCSQNLDIFNVWEIRQLEARQSVRDNHSYRSKSCPFRVSRCEPCLFGFKIDNFDKPEVVCTFFFTTKVEK